MNYERIDKSTVAGAELMLVVRSVVSEAKAMLSNVEDFIDVFESCDKSIVNVSSQIDQRYECDSSKEIQQFVEDVRDSLNRVQSLCHDYATTFSVENKSTSCDQPTEDSMILADATNALNESMNMLESTMMYVHSCISDVKSDCDKIFQILLNASKCKSSHRS